GFYSAGPQTEKRRNPPLGKRLVQQRTGKNFAVGKLPRVMGHANFSGKVGGKAITDRSAKCIGTAKITHGKTQLPAIGKIISLGWIGKVRNPAVRSKCKQHIAATNPAGNFTLALRARISADFYPV